MNLEAHIGASGLEVGSLTDSLKKYAASWSQPATAPASSTPSKPAESDAKANTIAALYAQIVDVANDFRAVGFPNTLATTYAIAQMMFESNWMTSHVAHVDNNYSGITWLNKPYQDATRGLPKPMSEGGGYYAHYKDFRAYAKDYLRVLSLNTGGKGRPIDATTSTDYFVRLHANKYFQADPAAYARNLNSALNKVGDALRWGAAQDKKFTQQYNQGERTFTETAGKGLTSNAEFDTKGFLITLKNWANDNPLKAFGAAALTVIAITKIAK